LEIGHVTTLPRPTRWTLTGIISNEMLYDIGWESNEMVMILPWYSNEIVMILARKAMKLQ
jgi:hypothetical protein